MVVLTSLFTSWSRDVVKPWLQNQFKKSFWDWCKALLSPLRYDDINPKFFAHLAGYVTPIKLRLQTVQYYGIQHGAMDRINPYNTQENFTVWLQTLQKDHIHELNHSDLHHQDIQLWIFYLQQFSSKIQQVNTMQSDIIVPINADLQGKRLTKDATQKALDKLALLLDTIQQKDFREDTTNNY